VRAAKAVDYVGAGTVEFIMDADQKFYFMEMNTRLQVEHPVTEMITGTDLVDWQLRVAAGEQIPLKQEEIKVKGHAFEARIYAEDPESDFMPGAGPLDHLDTPTVGSELRVETGVRQGDQVSVHYDPMIAKLVVWSGDRQSALKKTQAALRDYHVVGLSTNIQFLMNLAAHPAFQAAEVDTEFIPRHHDSLFPPRPLPPSCLAHAALALTLIQRGRVSCSQAGTKDGFSPFGLNFGARVNGSQPHSIVLQDGDSENKLSLQETSPGTWCVSVNGSDLSVTDVSVSPTGDADKVTVRCSVDGVMTSSTILTQGSSVHVFTVDGLHSLEVPAPAYQQASSSSGSIDDPVAPMPGVIERVVASPGQQVAKGDPLVVMIAMKMEYVIRASRDGTVDKVNYKQGDTVAKGTVLVKLQEE